MMGLNLCVECAFSSCVYVEVVHVAMLEHSEHTDGERRLF